LPLDPQSELNPEPSEQPICLENPDPEEHLVSAEPPQAVRGET
jgi:hypothetical protein